MGFGVGIAIGPAAVGTIGYEGRIDYTAIGNVVHLASRLSCGANDTQMLVDAIVAKQEGVTQGHESPEAANGQDNLPGRLR